MNIYKQNYIKIIKDHMKANRWNQAIVARELGVSRGAISAVFTKKIDGLTVVKRICDVIGLSYKELLE